MNCSTIVLVLLTLIAFCSVHTRALQVAKHWPRPSADDTQQFGSSVAVDEKSNLIVAGAPLYESPVCEGVLNTTCGNLIGSVSIFDIVDIEFPYRRTEFRYRQTIYNPGLGHSFGKQVAIENGVVFVSAPFDSSCVQGVDLNLDFSGRGDNCFESGAIAIYTEQYGGLFELKLVLKPPNPQTAQMFGSAIDVYDDKLVVGAPFDRTCREGEEVVDVVDNLCYAGGAAYVYQFYMFPAGSESAVFDLIGVLQPSQSTPRARAFYENQAFGSAVAVSRVSPGGGAPFVATVAVGASAYGACGSGVLAEGEDIALFGHGADEVPKCTHSGIVYVFTFESLDSDRFEWRLRARIKQTDVGLSQFGFAVSLEFTMLAVGMPSASGGAVYLYNVPAMINEGIDLKSVGAQPTRVLTPLRRDFRYMTETPYSSISFGEFVDLDYTGTMLLLVGAPQEPKLVRPLGLKEDGALYLFELRGGVEGAPVVASQMARLEWEYGDGSSRFGQSGALYGENVVFVGAPLDSTCESYLDESAGEGSGEATVHTKPGIVDEGTRVAVELINRANTCVESGSIFGVASGDSQEWSAFVRSTFFFERRDNSSATGGGGNGQNSDMPSDMNVDGNAESNSLPLVTIIIAAAGGVLVLTLCAVSIACLALRRKRREHSNGAIQRRNISSDDQAAASGGNTSSVPHTARHRSRGASFAHTTMSSTFSSASAAGGVTRPLSRTASRRRGLDAGSTVATNPSSGVNKHSRSRSASSASRAARTVNASASGGVARSRTGTNATIYSAITRATSEGGNYAHTFAANSSDNGGGSSSSSTIPSAYTNMSANVVATATGHSSSSAASTSSGYARGSLNIATSSQAQQQKHQQQQQHQQQRSPYVVGTLRGVDDGRASFVANSSHAYSHAPALDSRSQIPKSTPYDEFGKHFHLRSEESQRKQQNKRTQYEYAPPM